MDVLQMTSRKRETYYVQLHHSILWECALGIAAITNTPMLHTLEKEEKYWRQLKQSMSKDLLDALSVVEKHNTWKCILQILHEKNFANVEEFSSFIMDLPDERFTFICLPFTGEGFQKKRKDAAHGSREAMQVLQEETKDHPFFPAYIEYVSTVNREELKNHLIHVMHVWYTEVVQPEETQLVTMLEYDQKEKEQMMAEIPAEEFVQWATGGITYVPEPSIHKVLLIPQYVYRPWNIEADIEGTKVFYYPISNTSIAPEDPYIPPDFLVEKYKALGDETRLRIVKILAEKEHSLQQLTDRMEIGKSTIHHHLKLLRSAKLVTIEAGQYVLKRETLHVLGKELELYTNQ